MTYAWQEEIDLLKKQIEGLKLGLKINCCWNCHIAGQIENDGFCLRCGVYQ